MVKTRNFLIVLLVLVSFFGNAQKTLVYGHEDANYKKAIELLENEKYTAAQRAFKKVYDRIEEPHSEVKMNAEYYIAFCALELFNKDAEYLFIKFIDHHPQSPKVRRARYQLGRFSYRKKRWSSTIKWFEQVDENDLEPEEITEFNFKFGYSLFKKKKYQEAKQYFYKTKTSEGDYAIPASFYYSHLEYQDGKYETAYQGFKALENDEAFGPIVPYYITQILYLQKKYEDLIVFGALFLDSASTKRAPEIARLVGEGYYNLGDYDKSAKYFKTFMDKTNVIDTLAYYQLGYSYYKIGNFGGALANFQKAADTKSPTGQLALYYIGDCYIKVGNKKAARSAFKFASKNDHNLEITENALFNYAKLSFELDIDPYHESIIALEKFIKKYPNSPNVNKARKYLLNVYLNTNNYQKAIEALEKIEDKNMDLKYAYQKISYYRGVQVYNNEKIGFGEKNTSNYLKAIYFFDKSLKFPVDQEVVSLAHYWTAEAKYKLGKYASSIKSYRNFQKSPSSIMLPEYKEVDYQVGYAYMKLRDYGKAIKAYRVYLDKHRGEKSVKINDAVLRTGDAYLILSNNLKGASRKNELIHASNYYKKSIDLGLREVDYAYYQLGQSYKLLHKFELEAEAYENLIFKYPNSVMIDDAKFNAGFVYFEELQRFDLAIKYFNDIVENHQNNVDLVQQSLNHIAVIKKSEGKFEEAIKIYERCVLLKRETQYAEEALSGHEQIATYQLKDASIYSEFRKTTGLPAISEYKNDTIHYEVAKASYLEALETNSFGKSIQNCNTYINQFSNGLFVTGVQYMLAESHFLNGDKDAALENFEKVIAAPYGDDTDESLFKSANIHMEAKSYQKAISRYLMLIEKADYAGYIKDAQIGLMTAYNELGDHENTAKYAMLVEKNPMVVDNTAKFRASLLYGNSLLKAYKFDEALAAFERTVAGTQKVMAAEAQYNIAYIYYVQEKYEDSKLAITKLLQELSVYQDWASMSFILYSDIYVKEDDYFQAKITLNTVIENHDGEDIVNLAKKKLTELEELEKAAVIKVEKEEEGINIGGASDVNQDIFDVEEEEENESLDSLQMNNVAPADSTGK